MLESSSDTIKFGSWSFHEIKIEDMKMYSDYIKKTECPANLFSGNFAYIWAISQSKSKTVYWKIVDGMLVTFVYTRKNSLYLLCLPYGRGNSKKIIDVLKKCLNYCYELNGRDNNRTLINIINDDQLEFLRKSPDFDKYFKLVTLVGIERHFDIKKMVALYGKDFKNIRNRVNKFYKDNPDAKLCDYDESDYDKLIELSNHWSSTAGQKYARIFDKVYFKQIVKNYSQLGQIILTIKIGEKIVGMISGSELPTGQAWGSVIKFESGIPGLSETLMIEFAKRLYERNPATEILNVGSDLGVGGLREYKLKFRPVLNFKRYQVYLKK